MIFLGIKHYLLCVAFIFSVTASFAQSGIHGKIKDAQEKEIPYVNVLLNDLNSGKILGYSTSDTTGFYEIKFKEQTKNKKITFRSIGYSEKTIVLSDSVTELNVVLSEDDYFLKEVVVRPQAIRVKNDTTEYLVASFSDGTERAIEDVIKNLPGVDVQTDGKIYFKGKEIEKITLDQTDLFDSNYKLASKNVPAKYVSKIQAIENYHENRLLRNVANSDKVILNLSLKEDLDAKNLFGEMEGGAGYQDKYSVSSNLFSINRKYKIFDTFSVNNSEISTPFEQSDNMSTLYEYFDSYANSAVVSDYFDSFDSYGIKRSETQRKFNSFNAAYQLSEKIQLTGNLLFNLNKDNLTDSNKLLYYVDSLEINKVSSVENKPQTLLGVVKMKYDIRENAMLEYHGKFDLDSKKMTNNMSIPEAYSYYTNTKNEFFVNDLKLTLALKDSSAIIFNSGIFKNENSQQFRYVKIDNQVDEIDQYIRSDNLQYNMSVSYYNKNKTRFYYQLDAIFNHNEQKMQPSLLLKDDNIVSPEISLSNTAALLGLNATYKIGKSAFTFDSKLGYRKQNLNILDSDNRFEISPRISYQWMSENHKLSVFGAFSTGQLKIDDYLNYFSDYRNLNMGTNLFQTSNSISYGLSYFYFNTMNQSFFLLSYVNLKNKNLFVPKMEITPAMSYGSLVPGQNRDNQFLLINIKKYIDAIRHSVNIDNNLNYFEYANFVNSDSVRINKNYNTYTRISIKSVFSIPVNYTLGGIFRYNIFKTNTSNENHSR